ncbi:MAG: MOSC N-terminal beta barrel domain-containing protein [Bacteroidota bacterium]
MNNSKLKPILSEIWIYPVKSLGGISLNEAEVTERGLQYDRRWLIVDEQNRFLTQRTFPQMVFMGISLIIENNQLKSITFTDKTAKFDNYNLLNPERKNVESNKVMVQIWDDQVEAFEIKDGINDWLSNALGIKCRLVYMPNSTKRKVDSNYAISGDEITSFSDAYPYLIIGNEALKLLNSKLEKSISMDRFRPNFVFEGGLAHEEDNWFNFQIGEAEFTGVKNCARCVIPTINHKTALFGKEPLKTLSSYRFKNNKILFGQNLLVNKIGKVKLGDSILILSIKN